MNSKDNTVNIKASFVKANLKARTTAEGEPRKSKALTKKVTSPQSASTKVSPRKVNSIQTNAKKSYHHGDLRTSLLEAGFRLLEDRNGEALGLREVARAVGVSPTAIYRHFPDKAALMLALAHEGLERLGAAQQRASQKADGGRAALVASGVTYVRFASANPALFRLIFSYVPPISPLDASLDEVGLAMRGLREGIHATMPPHFSDAKKKAATLMAWSLVHGLAELLLNGHIAKDWKMIETVVSSLNISEFTHP